jgi:hypothetical protein
MLISLCDLPTNPLACAEGFCYDGFSSSTMRGRSKRIHLIKLFG